MSTDPQPPVPLAGAPRRILVVDDDPTLCTLLEDFAQLAGVEVEVAGNATAGLAALQARPFGLLVTDICMPGDHGLLFARKARELPGYAKLPILVLSGRFDQAALGKIPAALPNLITAVKPLPMEDFHKILSAALPEVVPPKPPARTERPEFAFRLDVDRTREEARLVAETPGPGLLESPHALEAELHRQGVIAGRDAEAAGQAFLRLYAREVQAGEAFVVARGRLPVDGEPGRVDLRIDASGKSAFRPEEDDAGGAIDFRAAVRIVAVHPGEALADLTPPTPGTDGLSLTGAALRAKAGARAPIQPGEGVRLDESGRVILAAVHGRPVVLSGRLCVLPVYEVPGDVDFSTGHIDFRGHVQIAGSLQDDFSLTCDSAEIAGAVGACRICCRGNLTVLGGIQGRGRASITVQGDADLRYVNQAEVTVFGNLHIAREAVNSRLWCQGKATIGHLMGGHCLALLGIEARTLGSELGVVTEVEPGANFEVRKIELEIEALEAEIDALLAPIASCLEDRAAFRALPAETRDAARQGFARFVELKTRHESLTADRNMLVTMAVYKPVREARVRDLLHPDVILRTEYACRRFQDAVRGPLRLVEDLAHGTIQILSDLV